VGGGEAYGIRAVRGIRFSTKSGDQASVRKLKKRRGSALVGDPNGTTHRGGRMEDERMGKLDDGGEGRRG